MKKKTDIFSDLNGFICTNNVLLQGTRNFRLNPLAYLDRPLYSLLEKNYVFRNWYQQYITCVVNIRCCLNNPANGIAYF